MAGRSICAPGLAAPRRFSASRGRPSLTEPRPGVVRYLVAPSCDGQRLDRALAGLSELPRRRARLLVEAGEVWLNGRPCRVLSRGVRTGDVLDVLAQDEPLRPPEHTPAVELLLDDGWLVAVNKPAGVHTQPPRRRVGNEMSFAEQCVLALSARDGQRVRLGLFHRLDRITSGVLLLTRHREASRGLDQAWRAGKVEKCYLAVILGDPGPDRRVVQEPIAPDPLIAGRFRVDQRGRKARTDFRRIATIGDLALVAAFPLTGRTHQVRVHLQHAAHPVAGDHLYGGGEVAPRPYLHAWRLTFPHPWNERTIRIEAPLPRDMEAFMIARGWDPGVLSRG